jgi:hypothetical protein
LFANLGNLMRSLLSPAAILCALSLLQVSAPATAREYQCSVTDPAGDPTDSPGNGYIGEQYQDMVQSGIERTAGAMTFSMEVVAPIPAAPQLRVPNGLLLWMWGMNTTPTVPSGYPLPPGQIGLLEFWIHLAWNGQEFYAEVIDRRPALQRGEAPIVTRVPFIIDGRAIKVIASPSLFDDPQEYRWGSTTWIWSSHLASAGAHAVDRAPDSHVSTCTTN